MSVAPPPPPQVSADGKFYWEGARWVPMRDGANERGSLKGSLDLIAASVGVIAVLLPVEGFVIRWGSFINAESVAGFKAPAGTVAVSAAIPDLVATGLAGVLTPAVAFMFGAGAVGRLLSLPFIPHRGYRHGLTIWILLIGAPILLSFEGTLVGPLNSTLVGPLGIGPIDWIAAAVGFDTGVIAFLLIQWWRPSVLEAIALAAALSLSFAYIASFTGNPANVVPLDYQFQSQATLPAGRYVSLGHADGVTYLQSCVDLSFHEVRDAQIVDARFVEHKPSLA
jgi:hypothetical protein